MSFLFVFLFFLFCDLSAFFQLGRLLFGAADIAYNDIKLNKIEKQMSETRVAELNTKLTKLKKTYFEKSS